MPARRRSAVAGDPAAGAVEDLEQLCTAVGDLADRLGQLIAAVHGGPVTFPQAADVPSEGES